MRARPSKVGGKKTLENLKSRVHFNQLPFETMGNPGSDPKSQP